MGSGTSCRDASRDARACTGLVCCFHLHADSVSVQEEDGEGSELQDDSAGSEQSCGSSGSSGSSRDTRSSRSSRSSSSAAMRGRSSLRIGASEYTHGRQYTKRMKTLYLDGALGRPQRVGGRSVWPEHWGITRPQVRELLLRLRADRRWRSTNNVYTLVSDFIIPWTSGRGVSYALELNREEPQRANVMISHAFQENAEAFLEAVLRATDSRDVLYICALSNYQAADGAGPTIQEQLGLDPAGSPFRRVLENIAATGKQHGCRWRAWPLLSRLPTGMAVAAMALVLIPAAEFRPLFWTWSSQGMERQHGAPDWWFWGLVPAAGFLCGLSLVLHLWLRSWPPECTGRMIVVPNHQIDIYSRLWCVYESFVAATLGVHIELAPTVAPAGSVNSRDAQCSSDADAARILGEIEEDPKGFDRVDRSVRRTLRAMSWHTFGVWLKYALLHGLPLGAQYALLTSDDKPLEQGSVTTMTSFYLMMMFLSIKFVGQSGGVVEVSGVSCAVSICSIAGRLIFRAVQLSTCRTGCKLMALAGAATYDATEVMVVVLAALCRPAPRFFRAASRLSTTGVLLMTMAGFRVVCRAVQSSPFPNMFALILDAFLYSWIRVFPVYMFWTEAVRFGIATRFTSRRPALVGYAAWGGLTFFVTGTMLMDGSVRYLTSECPYPLKAWV